MRLRRISNAWDVVLVLLAVSLALAIVDAGADTCTPGPGRYGGWPDAPYYGDKVPRILLPADPLGYAYYRVIGGWGTTWYGYEPIDPVCFVDDPTHGNCGACDFPGYPQWAGGPRYAWIGPPQDPTCGALVPCPVCQLLYVPLYDVTDGDYDCDGIPDSVDSDPAAMPFDINLGKPLTCNALRGNPVNVATGNKFEEVLDLSVSTPGIPLQFKRYYNGVLASDGPLGYGWTHNFGVTLQVVATTPYTRIKIRDADGRALYFQPIMQTYQDGTHFYGESGVKDRLIQLTSGSYLLRRPDGLDYSFDSGGKLTQIADASGNALTFTYTSGLLTQVSNNVGKSLTIQYSGSRISSVTDPKSQSISYSYTGSDLTQVAYPDSRSVDYAYTNHLLTDKYDTGSNLIGHWAYDASGRVVSHYRYMDNGVPQEQMTFTYGTSSTTLTTSKGDTVYNTTMIDGIKAIASIEGCGATCGGNHKSFTYNDRVDLTDVTFTSGGQEYTTHYVYDTPTDWWDLVGEIVQTTEAVGWPEERTTSFTYTHRTDHPFLLTQGTEVQTSVVSPSLSKVTTTAYDTGGNVTSVAHTGYVLVNETPTQQTRTTSYQYNTLGQLTQINGPRTDVSDITTFTYYPNTSDQGNNRGQLHAVVNALNQTTQLSDYDANGNVGTITDPNGVVTTFTYDQRNRLLTANQSTSVTQYAYDGRGNISYIVLPEATRIDYTYTLSDKVAGITDTLGNRITYAYDVEGNRISEDIYDPQDTLRKYLDFTYDAYNRLKRIVNPDTTYTEYTYDDKGNRTAVRDPRANTTNLSYDPLDRLTGTTQPLNTLTDYGYDGHDNPTAVVDPKENTTSYSFDDFGSRYQVVSPDTGTSTYAYDLAGNVTQQVDANGTTINYTYDALNRLTAVQFPADSSQNIAYTYDSGTNGAGRLTGRTDPSGTYAFSYDARGNLIHEQKTVSGVLYTTQYAYNKENVLTSVTYPSGRVVTYTIGQAQKVTQVGAMVNGTPQTLASGITYLPFGGVTGMTYGNSLSLTRGYDDHYRVSSITVGSILNLSYSYDPNGNVTSILDAVNPPAAPLDQEGTYSYPQESNRLSSVTPSMTLGYDDNGNITSENSRVFTYDLLNRLIAVSDGTPIAQYTYNASGQRIKKTTGAGTTIFHYDLQGHLIAETTSTGSPIVDYVYLNDQLFAAIRAEAVSYYHNDHLGTPRVLTDSTGTVVWKASYTPFGKAQTSVASVDNPFRFPGQYYDTETGLHYNYHRYYQPETGRYVTPDPIGLAGGVNLYGYVGGEPGGMVRSVGT